MKVVAEDDPRLEFVTRAEAGTAPPGLVMHWAARWWVVHPSKGLAFARVGRDGPASPLCNADERIARMMLASHPWAEVEFVPSAFRSVRARDYA